MGIQTDTHSTNITATLTMAAEAKIELEDAEIDNLADELAAMMKEDGDLMKEIYSIVETQRRMQAEEDVASDQAVIDSRMTTLMNHITAAGGDLEDEEVEELFTGLHIDLIPSMVFFKYCSYLQKKVKKGGDIKGLIAWLPYASVALKNLNDDDKAWVAHKIKANKKKKKKKR